MAWLTRPWFRRPIVFGVGFGAAIAGGLLFQPHWHDLCSRINSREFVDELGRTILRGNECAPVSPMTMSGNFLIGFGLFMLVIGPIIFSLWQVMRRGYNWESSRVETAVSNMPMLAGILYMAAGVGIALIGTS